MSDFKEGDLVIVEQPDGPMPGKVVKVRPNYAWTGNTHYEVHGTETPYITTCSARVMRPLENDDQWA